MVTWTLLPLSRLALAYSHGGIRDLRTEVRTLEAQAQKRFPEFVPLDCITNASHKSSPDSKDREMSLPLKSRSCKVTLETVCIQGQCLQSIIISNSGVLAGSEKKFFPDIISSSSSCIIFVHSWCINTLIWLISNYQHDIPEHFLILNF